jgi:dinuclear metal center YbgI/SA1388 family protein
MPTVAAVLDFLRRFAPLELAAEGDNVGLLLGDDAAEVSRVMTCLTVTPASAAEAVAEKAQLIVTHHPIFYRPVQRLSAETAEGRMLLPLVRAGVAVYSPHTAFDNTAGGINDILCRRLGLTDVRPLRPFQEGAKCKIVVFVPDKDLERVSTALFKTGAGVIGEYRECSYRLQGTGTFFGTEGTSPTVGRKGRREEVAEWRLEVVCPEHLVEHAVQAMRAAHSYEEPAFDVYPLRPLPAKGGMGRVGTLPRPQALKAFARKVQQALAAEQVQIVGPADRSVRTVAVACGAGRELLHEAIRAGVNVFLTGELRFHDYLAAEAQDLALVLPGHYATERPGVEELATILAKEFPGVKVWPSKREADPAWGV